MDAQALLREARALRRRVDELGDQCDALKEKIDQEVQRAQATPSKPTRRKNDADPFDTGDGDDSDGDDAKP